MRMRNTLLHAVLFALCFAMLPVSAKASIGGFNNPLLKISTPTTPADLFAIIGCEENSQIYDQTADIQYIVKNCGGMPVLHQIWPPLATEISGLNTSAVPESGTNVYFTAARAQSAVAGMNVSAFTNDAGYLTAGALTPYLTISNAAATYLTQSSAASTYLTQANAVTTYLTQANAASTYATSAALSAGLATKLTTPTGTSVQYLDGLGSPQNFPAAASWTFQYPSRALNSCFQISATKDANFTYSADISALLTLGGGTAVATSYTNSGCTTGAQALANGAVSSVALGGTSSIPLVGWLLANHWAKITATASGGGSAAIDAVQSEAIKP